jgi:hypothetical protein
VDLHQRLHGTDAGKLHYSVWYQSRFSKAIWVMQRICGPGDAWHRGIGNVTAARAEDGLGQVFAALG